MNRLGALGPAIKGFFFPVEKPAEAPVSPGMPPVEPREEREEITTRSLIGCPSRRGPRRRARALPPVDLGLISAICPRWNEIRPMSARPASRVHDTAACRARVCGLALPGP